MAERCAVGINKSGRWMERCEENALPDRMFCDRHFKEAMARVAMVSPVVTGSRWSGVVRASQLGRHGPMRSAT